MAADDANPKTDSARSDPANQQDCPTVLIVVEPSGKQRLEFSQGGPEYSRRIAQKLVRAKVPSGTWNNYNCRGGTVVHFVSSDGEPLGVTQPLQKLQVCVVAEQKTVRGIFVRDLQGPNGKQIDMPSVADPSSMAADSDSQPHTPSTDVPTSGPKTPDDVAPLAAKPLADWGHLKTKSDTQRTGKPAAAKQLPDAASAVANAVPLPSRATGEAPSWAFDRTRTNSSSFASSEWGVSQNPVPQDEWKWLKPSAAAETQLRELLEDRNGDLHLKRQQTNEKRQQRREPLLKGPTWIDSFFQIARQKFRTLDTPLCRLAEVYLRPDYLAAPHADKKSATMIVDRAVGLMMTAKKSKKTALKKFAAELLARGQVPDIDKVEIAATARKELNQLAKNLSDPRTSLGDGLQIIMHDLGDSIRSEYEQMRKSGNESDKIEIIEKCRGALSVASKSKAFRQCTSEQRDELKGVINGWGDRITSYVNTNKLPQPGNRDR